MSRPTKGVAHVDALEGDAQSKDRLATVLETIAGTRTVESACEALALSPARFHELRRAALEGALAALTPKPAGRPAAPGEPPEIERLRREIATLRCDLEASQIREELALVMPQVLKPRTEAQKKTPPPANRDGRRAT